MFERRERPSCFAKVSGVSILNILLRMQGTRPGGEAMGTGPGMGPVQPGGLHRGRGPVSLAPSPRPCPGLSGWCQVQHLLRSTSTPVSMLRYDTKHRYFSQDARTSQTKPLRKPNVQNKIMYTRLAPGLRPAQLALLGMTPRGRGGERKLVKGTECPNNTHTQGVPTASTQGRS